MLLYRTNPRGEFYPTRKRDVGSDALIVYSIPPLNAVNGHP